MIFTMSHRISYSDTSALLNGWKTRYRNHTWSLFNLQEDIGETTGRCFLQDVAANQIIDVSLSHIL